MTDASGPAGEAPRGIDGLVTSESVKKICAVPTRERRQLIEALERHYRQELNRISPSWLCYADGPAQPPVDVAETVGVPGVVLGAVLAGKCRDQHIPVTTERQKRFAECMQMHCGDLWFTLNDSGVGPECAKGLVLTLALNDRFTSLNLACNTLGNAGASIIARVLPEHRTLIHLDLSANDIGHAGGNALFESLQLNSSLTSLDMSSKPGSLRNHLSHHNAFALDRLLTVNPVLAKLILMGNSLGPEGTVGLARGLSKNMTLLSLDLAGNDLGPRGFTALAEALVCCGLEELNLSDNRAGDDGLAALAIKLGALPSSLSGHESTWTGNSFGEGLKASSKYIEALSSLRRAISDLDPTTLEIHEESARRDALARVHGCAAQLAATIEAVKVPLPKLKILNLAVNNASNAGIARIEDSLQLNRALERLVIDQSDHRLEWGAKSLVTALPVNSTLKQLSLSQCGLSSASIMDISKALALNQALEWLSLRGNPFNEDAARALGALLGSGASALRHLNLSSCRLEDAAGVHLGNGLATNIALEVLHIRDNLLREGSGRTFEDALRKHKALVTLSLELNSIDFRYLQRIKQMLERNSRLHQRARPSFYTKRIGQLQECEKEVKVLANTLKRNQVRKRKAKMKQAAVLQELKDSQKDEEQKDQVDQAKLAAVRELQCGVDEEISEVQSQLREVCSQGDHDVSTLRSQIEDLENKIKNHKRHIEKTQNELQQFENQAKDELATLREELGKKEKERNIASTGCEAAHRHLDNFAASMRSIEPDLAGGADPRLRVLEQEQTRNSNVVAKQPPAPPPKNGSRPTPGLKAAPKPSPKAQAPR
jgi:Ran GTPase-activating protein (RanGAP) involved in mRNA processing and transport